MNSPAKFRVRDTFTITSKNYFVLIGSISEGVIKAGMEILVPLNSSVPMEATIHSIELVRSSDHSDVGLTIKCASTDEMILWQSLNIKDELLKIREKEIP